MYKKRLRTYKKIGFGVYEGNVAEKQNVNAIYDSGNYSEIFESDLIEAERSVVISSPHISTDKIERLIDIMKERQAAGVLITVITNEPGKDLFADSDSNVGYELVARLRKVGINVILKDETDECFALKIGRASCRERV